MCPWLSVCVCVRACARRGNLALAVSVDTHTPVRVLRGFKLQSPFAPPAGYRYDGLYLVKKYWQCVGLSGHSVYKYLFQRLPDQPAAPWATEGQK